MTYPATPIAQTADIKTEINQLEQTLKDLLSEETSFPGFQRAHIFSSILKACGYNLDVQQKMAMYYHFHCYDKALTESRNTRNFIARYWVRYVDNLKHEFAPLPATGLKALYYPMVAFIDYAEKHYDEAVEKLDQSLKYIEQLEENGVKDALIALTEQNFNKFRLYCTCNDAEKALYYAERIIAFIFAQPVPDNPISERDIRKTFETDPPEDWAGMNHYYLNSIIAKFPRLEEAYPKEKIMAFWERMSTQYEWPENPVPGIAVAFRLLHAAYAAEPAEYLAMLGSHSAELVKLPVLVQEFLIKKALDMSEQSGYAGFSSLRDTAREYYINILKLEKYIPEQKEEASQ